MHVFNDLEEAIKLASPCILTVGTFDGIHLGHQKIINRVKELSKKYDGQTSVICFSNHPSEILSPSKKRLLITSPLHKEKLLRDYGIDFLFLIPFTQSFSEFTSQEFLETVDDLIPFSHLILGHDAALGKNREGTPEVIRRIAETLGFIVEYQEPLILNGNRVSSSMLRNAIQIGDFKTFKTLTGRNYSIVAKVDFRKGHDKFMDFSSVHLNVEGLCLPPAGVYTIRVIWNGYEINGIVHLSFSLKEKETPLLEIQFHEQHEEIYHHEIEVVFRQKISEKNP